MGVQPMWRLWCLEKSFWGQELMQGTGQTHWLFFWLASGNFCELEVVKMTAFSKYEIL